MTESIEIPISSIHIDESKYQMRVYGTRKKTVESYAALILDGATFPPIIIVDTGGQRILCDGFHRVSAHVAAGRQTIEAVIIEGDDSRAVEEAVRGNSKNALQMSREDQNLAICRILCDPVLGQRSYREIGSMVGCSHTHVSNTRKRLVERGLIGEKTETVTGGGVVYKKPDPRLPRSASVQETSTSEVAHTPTNVASELPADITTQREQTTSVMLSSKSNEWYTGDDRILGPIKEMLGEIELDPASCAYANEQFIQAKRFYSKEMNGLKQSWGARTLFNNPPYGKGKDNKSNMGRWTHHFLKKSAFYGAHMNLSEEELIEEGFFLEGLLLLNAEVGAKWFKPLWRVPLCFPDFRTSFEKAPWMENESQPAKYNVIVYAGERVDEFERIFEKIGEVILPRKELFFDEFKLIA